MMPDDIDGLVSAAILQKVFGYPITYFYDFKGLFCNELSFLCPEPIGVDLSLVRGKTIANEVCRVSSKDSYNQEAVNLNLIDGVTAGNYTSKFSGSSAIFLISLFRDELKIKDNELFWSILLSIDSFFKGYKSEFRQRQKYYLVDVLELPAVYELQERYSVSDFKEVQNKLKMKEKIHLTDGQLNIQEDHFRELLSYIGLDMPVVPEGFYQVEQYKKVVVPYGNVLTIDKSNYSTFCCSYKRSGIATAYLDDKAGDQGHVA